MATTIESPTKVNVPSKSSDELKEITLEALATRTDEQDLWLAFEGIVYRVPPYWISEHPGGEQAILMCAGIDATAFIRAMHNPATIAKIRKTLKKVGKLKVDQDAPEHVKRARAIEKDFADLHEVVTENGWYDKSIASYWIDAIRVLSFLLGGLFLLYQSSRSSNDWTLEQQKSCLFVGSCLLGGFLQNIAFLGHDAGHNSLTGDMKHNFRIGIALGNALTGVSMSWWKSTHNCHHVVTNSLQDDPDIQHIPLFVFDESMAHDWWSTYHGRKLTLGTIGRKMVRYQYLYFYPVMSLARINLYIQSVLHLWELRPGQKGKVVEQGVNHSSWKPNVCTIKWLMEVGGLATYYSLLATLVYCLGPIDGALCLLISHMTAGILHVQILLSHIMMDYCMDDSRTSVDKEKSAAGAPPSFYEWQALSTMDIACPPWMNWFYGGLQYQLEHHLFPRVPSKNLHKLIPLVDKIFAKYNIPVVRLGFIEGNGILLKRLESVGAYVSELNVLPDDELKQSNAVAATASDDTSASSDEGTQKTIKIDGCWYDITRFAEHHPGGPVIEDFEGKDASEVFFAFHMDPAKILKRVKALPNHVNEEVDSSKDSDELEKVFAVEFRNIIKSMRSEGYFEGRKVYMLQKFMLVGIFFVLGWYLAFQGTRTARETNDPSMIEWKTTMVPSAVFVALFLQQCGFLVHDFMHNHWFHNRNIDQKFGRFFASFCVGLSATWWRDEHFVHHALTNTYESGKGIKDIQIFEDIWAQDEDLLQFFDGSIPSDIWLRKLDALPLWLSEKVIRCQAFLWLPLTVILGRMNIILASFVKQNDTLDRVLQVCHVTWFVMLLRAVFPTWQSALIFHFMVSIGQGVLHIQLLVNHYVKPWNDLPDMQATHSWYKMQMMSTANIGPFFGTRCWRSFDSDILDKWDDYYAPMIDDWFHGGLNLHIEHHTMPMLPRHSLRECSRRIRAFCRKNKMRYDERHFLQAVWDTLVRMNTVGKKASFVKTKAGKEL